MSETFAPLLYIDGYSAPATEPGYLVNFAGAYTAAELGDVDADVNNDGKLLGLLVWDSTNARPMRATGPEPTDSWESLVDAEEIEPMASLHYARITTDRSLTSTTNAQAIFPAANDTLTLETGVYEFALHLLVSSMSAVSGNASINLLGAGTATIAVALSSFMGQDSSAPSSANAQGGSHHQALASSGAVVTVGTGTQLGVRMTGTFDVTGAGTIVPSIALATAIAAVVEAGSSLVVRRLGPTGQQASSSWG